MRIEPFTASHYHRLVVQPAQVAVTSFFSDEHVAALQNSFSFSAVGDDGEILGCGGAIELWQGRATLWALVAGNTARHFVPIHRAVERFIHNLPQARVEATVQEGFAAGHRWVRSLGFQCETPEGMPRYSPDGTTHFLYARMK